VKSSVVESASVIRDGSDFQSPYRASRVTGVPSSTIHKWVSWDRIPSYPAPPETRARYPGALLVAIPDVLAEKGYRSTVVSANRAASLLGVTHTTVLYHCDCGHLAYTRRGKLYEIALEELDRFVDERTNASVAAEAERPGPRECALEGCGTMFTPDLSSWRRGYGRFCSVNHYGEHIRRRAAAGDLPGCLARYSSALAEVEQYAIESGLWSRRQTAEFLLLSEATVYWLEQQGILPADYVITGADESRRYKGWMFPLYHPRAVKQVARQRSMNQSAAAQRHRDPEWLLLWAGSTGMNLGEAIAYRQRVELRVERGRSLRTGLTHKQDLHQRWHDLWLALQAEYADAFPGESSSRFFADVALIDWSDHPEDWPRERYPGSRSDSRDFADGYVRHAARERVRRAVMRLIERKALHRG
jgi:hypothetical protein